MHAQNDRQKNHKTVYLIEDDQDILNMLTLIIKKNGHEVFSDYNGDQFDISRSDGFIYLIDVNLKGKSGKDICHEIKTTYPDAHVFLMSANTDLEKYATDCQADGFFVKPFNMSNLLDTLRSHLSG